MRTLSYFLVAIACVVALAAGTKIASAQGPSPISCREIAIIGAVNTPGRFYLRAPMRLIDVLKRAGGPTEQAGKVVRVTHFCNCSPCNEGVAKPDAHEYNLADVLRGEAQANPEIAAGDLVTVKEAELVRVVGNVLSEKSLVFREGLTLTQAIAMVGVARNSDAVRIRIYRMRASPAGPNPLIRTLKTVLSNPAEDLVLQPRDIIQVSDESGYFHRPVPMWNPPTNYPMIDPPLFPRKSTDC